MLDKGMKIKGLSANCLLIGSDSMSISARGPLGVSMKESSRSRNLRGGALVELDASVVSEALRLRVERGDGAVVEDDATDIWSELGLGREGRQFQGAKALGLVSRPLAALSN
jgi:hypothetical protein